MTKEERREYNKAYNKANKDRIKGYRKAYNKAYHEAHYNSKKHKPTVYLLVKENYVGVTENLDNRMRFHKHNGKDTSEVRILGEFDSRSDALEVEALIHDLGYKGQHSYNVYK